MPTFQELSNKVDTLEKEVIALKQRNEVLEGKIQGNGVIILSGNRLKIDESGSLSDYQHKS
jgi:hypothetical protein